MSEANLRQARAAAQFHTGPAEQKRAFITQQSVILDETDQIEKYGIRYSKEQIELSIVHARQDIILLASYGAITATNTRIILFWVRLVSITVICACAVVIWRFWP